MSFLTPLFRLPRVYHNPVSPFTPSLKASYSRITPTLFNRPKFTFSYATMSFAPRLVPLCPQALRTLVTADEAPILCTCESRIAVHVVAGVMMVADGRSTRKRYNCRAWQSGYHDFRYEQLQLHSYSSPSVSSLQPLEDLDIVRAVYRGFVMMACYSRQTGLYVRRLLTRLSYCHTISHL